MTNDPFMIIIPIACYAIAIFSRNKKASKTLYIIAIVFACLYIFGAFSEGGDGAGIRWGFLAVALVCAWLFSRHWERLEPSASPAASSSETAEQPAAETEAEPETKQEPKVVVSTGLYYCRECGKQLPRGCNFCIHCGAKQ